MKKIQIPLPFCFFLILLFLSTIVTAENQKNKNCFKPKNCIKQNLKKCNKVFEYPLNWPNGINDTHEFTYDPNGGKVFWVTGGLNDAIARVRLDGKATFFPMPPGSIPHGITFDKCGQLWITLEGSGFIARIDKHGNIVEQIDVHFLIPGTDQVINPGPHGLTTNLAGNVLWFVGKAGNTVGKVVLKDRSVEQFELPTPNSQPIYISAGSNDFMWVTEPSGNNIARVTQEGQITEFPIPTPNSRPVGIVPSTCDPNLMWFSEETSHKVASITQDGQIVEYQVPKTQNNMILASLTFDNQGNLWTLSYVNQFDPFPEGSDFLIRINRKIQGASSGDISCIPFTYHQLPTKKSVLHRIVQGPDGNMWFTQRAANQIGKLILHQ